MAAKGQKQSTTRVLGLTYAINGGAAQQQTTAVPSSVSLEEKVGMRIRAIDYFLNLGSASPYNMLAADDELRFGFSFLASQPSGGNFPNTPGVIDYNHICRRDIGAAAQADFIKDPMRKKLTDIHPDGILIHPANLYFWAYTPNQIGVPTNTYLYLMMYYTMEDISQEIWDDLWKQIFVSQAG